MNGVLADVIWAAERRQYDRETQKEEFGGRKTVHKHDFRQTTGQARIEHEMTYLPFQNWCGYIAPRAEDERRSAGKRQWRNDVLPKYI